MDMFVSSLLPVKSSNIPAQYNQNRYAYSTALQGPDRDVFERTTVTSPAFTSKTTDAGKCLKDLADTVNLTCAYTGMPMISGKKAVYLRNRLADCNNISEMIKVLAGYKGYMQPNEKNVYNIFENYAKVNESSSLYEACLRTRGINAKYYINENGALKKEENIAMSLIEPSIASIEHIHPESKDGTNNMSNFMLVCKGTNTERGNKSFYKYAKKHNRINKNVEKHVNEIISAIETGKLKECDWYPYVLKERLYNESNGIIDIDISKYKITEEDAFKQLDNIIKSNKHPKDNRQFYNSLKAVRKTYAELKKDNEKIRNTVTKGNNGIS